MYVEIINPITRKKVNINSEEGSQISKSYLKHINNHSRKIDVSQRAKGAVLNNRITHY